MMPLRLNPVIVSEPDDRKPARRYGAPPALGTLLALAEPAGWDMTPTDRIGHQNGVVNAMRLWSVLHEVVERLGKLESVNVHAPAVLWSWDVARESKATMGHSFKMELIGTVSKLSFEITIVLHPTVLERMEARLEFDENGAEEWHIAPPTMSLAYGQARAFVSALVFTVDAQRLSVGSRVGGIAR